MNLILPFHKKTLCKKHQIKFSQLTLRKDRQAIEHGISCPKLRSELVQFDSSVLSASLPAKKDTI